MRKLFLLAALLPLSIDLLGQVDATWLNPGSGSWSVGANWTGGIPPGSDGCTQCLDTATFGPNTTQNSIINADLVVDTSSLLLQAINFSGPFDFTVNVGAVSPFPETIFFATNTADNGEINITGTGTITISTPISMTTPMVIITQGSPNPLTLSGDISGPSPLVKTGSGKLILATVNTYLGGTTVSAGVLQCGVANALPNSLLFSPGSLTVNGGVVDLHDFNQTIGTLSGSGGTITLGSSPSTLLTVNTTSNGTYAGSISGAGVLLNLNSGILTLSGPNSYTGGTAIVAGTIQCGATNTLPVNGNVGMAGGSLNLVTFNQSIGNLAGTVSAAINLGSGQLTVNSSLGSVFAGGISGVGGELIHQGNGSLTLTGANSYSGGTFINGGSLIAGAVNTLPASGPVTVNGGTLSLTTGASSFNQSIGPLSGSGPISLGSAQLTVNTTTTSTYSGAMSGAGSFQLNGTGVLILGGNSTYTGLTQVNGGILRNNGNNALPLGIVTQPLVGDITITAPGVWDLNDFTQVSGALSGSGNITLGTGALILGNTESTTYSGVISEGGSLTLQGSGTFTLSNANTYTAGTFVNTGVLRNGVANALPTAGDVTLTTPGGWNLNSFNQTIGALIGSGNIAFGAGNTLVLGNGETTTYSGVITGAGHLTKQGSGTLILTGLNNYSAGTTVSAGVLQGDTTSLQGTITTGMSGTVTFNQSSSGTFVGTLAGVGTLIKSGTGSVTLTGAHNEGISQVNGGILSIASGATLTSPTVTVGPGGTLKGTGNIVGAVTNNGNVQPGTSIGTLTITGDYVQATGSTFTVEVSPSISSLLNVTGNLTIQPGANVALQIDPGTYASSALYTIMTAGTPVVGTFSSSIQTGNPFFSGTLQYNAPLPNSVQLLLSIVPFGPIVPGNNPQSIAACINPSTFDASPDFSSIIQTLIFLPVADVGKALDQMQPSQLKALSLTEENNLLLVRTAISQRSQELCQTYYQLDATNVYPVTAWGNLGGDFTSQQAQQENIGYHAKTGTIVGGVDGRIGKHMAIGLAGAFNRSEVHWKKSRGDGSIRSGYLGPYLGIYGEHGFMNLSCLGTLNNYAAVRRIKFSTLNRKAHNHHSGHGLIGHVDLGAVVYGGNSLSVSPLAGFDYVHIFEKGFTETGAQSLNLQVDRSKETLLRSELGLKLARGVMYESVTWTHDVKASWIYEKRITGDHSTASFIDQSCRFTVECMHPNRNLFNIATGLNGMFFEDRLSLSLRYEGEFGNRYNDQSAFFQLLLRF